MGDADTQLNLLRDVPFPVPILPHLEHKQDLTGPMERRLDREDRPTMKHPQNVPWRKSSRSLVQWDLKCVEVAAGGSEVYVRDSKNIAAGALAVTPAAWARLLGGIKSAG